MATVRETICKPFRVGPWEVTSGQIANAIDRMADLPWVFKASDVLPSILPNETYHVQQEALNRLFQRWRKLGLARFHKGLWNLEQDAWNQMQAAAIDARIPA